MKRSLPLWFFAAALLGGLRSPLLAVSRSERSPQSLRVEGRHQFGGALATIPASGADLAIEPVLDDEQLAALALRSSKVLAAYNFTGRIELNAQGVARVAVWRASEPETMIDVHDVDLKDWRKGLSRVEIAAVEGVAHRLRLANDLQERAAIFRELFDGGAAGGGSTAVTVYDPQLAGFAAAVRKPVAASDERREPPTPSREAPSRIPALDAARGLAILGMIPRNIAGIFMVGVANPHWFTAYGALVPALFLLINGFVVAYSTKKDNPFWYYAVRGIRVALVSGLVVDAMIWHIVPLTWSDILTTVGVVIPAIYLIRKLPPNWQLAAAAAAFAVAFPLRSLLGYSTGLVENDLTSISFVEPFLWAASFFAGNEILKRFVLKNKNGRKFPGGKIAAILTTAALFIIPLIRAFTLPEALAELTKGETFQHFLIDGWFPILPWIGFAILGSYLATRYGRFFKENDREKAEALAASFFNRLLGIGAILLALGIASWLFLTPDVVPRLGYTIPIFPPTWQYLLAATGGVLTVVGGFYAMRNHPWVQKPYAILQTMGRRSLEIYVLHELIGQLVFLKLLGFAVPLTWHVLTGVAITTVIACYIAAYLLEKYKFQPWL